MKRYINKFLASFMTLAILMSGITFVSANEARSPILETQRITRTNSASNLAGCKLSLRAVADVIETVSVTPISYTATPSGATYQNINYSRTGWVNISGGKRCKAGADYSTSSNYWELDTYVNFYY